MSQGAHEYHGETNSRAQRSYSKVTPGLRPIRLDRLRELLERLKSSESLQTLTRDQHRDT